MILSLSVIWIEYLISKCEIEYHYYYRPSVPLSHFQYIYYEMRLTNDGQQLICGPAKMLYLFGKIVDIWHVQKSNL